MYYPQSVKILQEIKKAKNILINVHKNPDLDTVGSSLAMMQFLKKIGKSVKIICPHKIEKNYLFLKYANKIETVDFSKFDFSPYDLFLILDTGSYDRVTGKREIKLPKMSIIIIDHHKTNNIYEGLRFIKDEACATCEIIYKFFTDWKAKINKEIATALFSGIAGDTVFFRYGKNAREIFSITLDLLKKGADRDSVVTYMYNYLSVNYDGLIGEFLRRMKYEKRGRFVWAAVAYNIFESYKKPKGAREAAADVFFRSVKESDLGIAMLEEEEGQLAVSFRSKKIDVTVLAEKLGGGGHINAAGATLFGKFDEMVRKVVDLAHLTKP